MSVCRYFYDFRGAGSPGGLDDYNFVRFEPWFRSRWQRWLACSVPRGAGERGQEVQAGREIDQSETEKSENTNPSLPPRVSPQPCLRRGRAANFAGAIWEWGAYTAHNNGRTVCYALAKPSSQATQPPNKPRDPAYIFVSTRPPRMCATRSRS